MGRPDPMSPAPTYELTLLWLREYAQRQKQCGYPATLKDLREYRNWKNMPQDSAFDAELLAEVNGQLKDGQ